MTANDWPECDRLDRPPNSGCYIRFPHDFGRRFMVFVDTEEEFDWSKPQSRGQRSTTHVKSLGVAHRRLSDYGAHPVYLIDHPIATDPRAVDLLGPLQEKRECGIGTHLHPWVNPPFDEEVNSTNSFAGNLPVELERAKLACLTETIEHAFRRRPIIYRAGRYGVGPATAALLRELGYKMDVSARAYYDYSDEKGPDYSRVKPLPYVLGGGDLLEVPLSAAFTGGLRSIGSRLFPLSGKIPLVRGGLARTRLMNRVSLTPEGVPVGQALEAVERLLDDDHQIISISFHSPSVEPGHTPYIRDGADLADFYRWWEAVLGLLIRRGLTAASIEDVLSAAERALPRAA